MSDDLLATRSFKALADEWTSARPVLLAHSGGYAPGADLLRGGQPPRLHAESAPPSLAALSASIKVLIAKLETVRQLQMSSIDVSRLNRNRVRVLTHLGAKYHRDSLLRFSQQKRAALLACYLQELQQELLDRLLTSFDDLIVSIFRLTESSEKTHHAMYGKALTRHIHTFRKVTKIVLDLDILDEQVRPRIFEDVPQAQLQAVHDESGTKALPEDGQAFDLLDHHYGLIGPNADPDV